MRGLRLSFEPADIVNEVMSFGSPTPIEVAVSGPKYGRQPGLCREGHDAAGEDRRRCGPAVVPVARLSHRRGGRGPGEGRPQRRDRGRRGPSLVAATSSSRFVVPNFWRDPDTGIGYQVQVEVPPAAMDSRQGVELVPVRAGRTGERRACPGARRGRMSRKARCPANTIATTCGGW